MATTLSKYEKAPTTSVGVHVYEPFKPQMPGRIVEYVGQSTMGERYRRPVDVVRVRWMNGKQTDHAMYLLQDFDALITETERKLNTHRGNLQKLQSVIEGQS